MSIRPKNVKIVGFRWKRNGKCSVLVQFSDKVSVKAGACIQVKSTGQSGNLLLYAAPQKSKKYIVFDRQIDMTLAILPDEEATYSLFPQTLVGSIIDSLGKVIIKIIDAKTATASGTRNVI